MAGFDGDSLRGIMRHVASPVMVVTFMDEKRPRGVTIGSFTSVSLNPPLIAFNVDRETAAHGMLERAGRIVVNVLSENQASLADWFALSDVPSSEQFESVETTKMEGEIPILEGATVILKCDVEAFHEAGDSSIVVAKVVDGQVNESVSPLLHINRTYRVVGSVREPGLRVPVNRPSSSMP